MNTSFPLKKSTLIFCMFLLLFLVNQLLCIIDVRPVMYDESWYASTGYNIANGLGIKNTIVGSGGDVNFIFPLFNAFFFKLFGYNLASIRLTAVFFGVITVIAIYYFLKRNDFNNSSTFSTLFLFTSLTLFNTIFRFGRPECASLAFLSVGIIAFCAYISNPSLKAILILAISAIFSGLAHPFALLPYCILGIILLIETILANRIKIDLAKLFILLGAGMLVIATLYFLANDRAAITERYSFSNFKNSIPVYFKGAFLSRHALGNIPIIAILFLELIFSEKTVSRYLAISGITTFVIFPFLFTTDLMMVGLGSDYAALIAVFVFPYLIEDITQRLKRGRILFIGVVVFSALNLAVSYYYNFAVKYEKANSVLSKEVKEIIPDGANVFGPIRLWPFAMNTQYISDHYRKTLPEYRTLDYIITSSQDFDIYPSYDKYKPFLIKENIIYKKCTKQYGMVYIYKCK